MDKFSIFSNQLLTEIVKELIMALNNKKTVVVAVCSLLLAGLVTARFIGNQIDVSPVEEIEQFPVGSFEVHAFLEQHNGG
jgi:hypothetical protein